MTQQTLPALRDWILSVCAIPSVSGFETMGHERLKALLDPYFDEIQTDAVGNLMAFRYADKENAPTVLVDSHFDEIGLLVTDTLDGGFLRVTSMGGIDPAILSAADVIVYGKQTLRGVVISKPPHLRATDEERKLPAVEELLIDVGYGISAEELRAIVPIGTPVGFSPVYADLTLGKENAISLAGKSFDDKACGAAASYAVASLKKESLAANVCVLFSAYEETSRAGGVSPAAFSLDPDYAMVIDVNFAHTPDCAKTDRTCPFGEGISLSMSAATDRRLTRMTRALCDEEKIPYSLCAAAMSTGTNSTSLNLVGKGIPVVDVGLPLKNMHTYNEIISVDDANTLCRLVQAFVCSETIAKAFDSDTYKEVTP